MGKGEDVEKAVQRRHRRPSSFHYFFRFSFLVWRALYWRRGAAPLVYRQGTSNSQMPFLFPFWGVTLAVVWTLFKNKTTEEKSSAVKS